MDDRLDPDERRALVERIRALSRPLAPEPTGLPVRLAPLAGLRAVLFDVYGTLVVSASGDVGSADGGDDERAARAALAEAGLPAPGPGVAASLVAAIRDGHAAARARGVEHPEVDILAVWASVLEDGAGIEPARLRAVAVGHEARANPVWPMPGALHVLDALRAKGLRLGIVSNAQFYTPLVLEALLGAAPAELGLEPALCAWSYRLGEAKPSTALFARALDGLARGHGITAAQTLYVGNDRLKDIWPARRMGCRTALFAGDRRSLRLREDDPRCADAEPDAVVDDLAQLLDLVR